MQRRTNGNLKRMESKFDGECSACKGWMPQRTEIFYDPNARKARHVECPQIPAQRPIKVLKDITPALAELTAKAAALEATIKQSTSDLAVSKRAFQAGIEALGGCYTCSGRGFVYCTRCEGKGYIRSFDTDYDCANHANTPCDHSSLPGELHGTRNPETLAQIKDPTLDPLRSTHMDIASKLAAAERALQTTRYAIDELKIVRKGAKVEVFKGRKIPVGTVGIVTWLGDNGYGMQVGIKVEGQEKLSYTAMTNVQVVARFEEVAA